MMIQIYQGVFKMFTYSIEVIVLFFKNDVENDRLVNCAITNGTSVANHINSLYW